MGQSIFLRDWAIKYLTKSPTGKNRLGLEKRETVMSDWLIEQLFNSPLI